MSFDENFRSHLAASCWLVECIFLFYFLYYYRITRPGVKVRDEFEVHREQAYDIRARHDGGIIYVCSVARSF